ncbi:MAG: hypothetical protein COW28_07750 [bacterium (Candidatus Ratteibacteria) CG15_BIG_FIL_POST_REV_8_21_14_020_41_12]|nr:MAG: hypothetical protein COW28_07750 [bacterium (Candidatus Ratteibacteria) CG15_BIG_FIL_POST_REV_8_21_14_020_41_12]
MFNLTDIEKLQKGVEIITGKYLLRKKEVTQKTEEEEQKRDYLAVPELIENLKSSSANIRANAALELGRIGDKRAIKALIESINDSAGEVSRNSIYALGWMQAKEAVPALTKATSSKDKWIRRRVTEALGLYWR